MAIDRNDMKSRLIRALIIATLAGVTLVGGVLGARKCYDRTYPIPRAELKLIAATAVGKEVQSVQQAFGDRASHMRKVGDTLEFEFRSSEGKCVIRDAIGVPSSLYVLLTVDSSGIVVSSSMGD